MGSYGISSVCSSTCLKITGSSSFYSASPIDASNYESISVEFDLDTWSFETEHQDTLYTQCSINNGNWEQISKTQTSVPSQQITANFPSAADNSNNIRLRFVTSASATDDAYIDNICVYGLLMPPAPAPTTAQPTTTQPSTTQPSTNQPTTAEPTTNEPTTHEPSTIEPSTVEPSTVEPTKTVIPTQTASPTIYDMDKEWIDETIVDSKETPPSNNVKDKSISGWIIFLICLILLCLIVFVIIIIKKRQKQIRFDEKRGEKDGEQNYQNGTESNVNLKNTIQLSPLPKTDNKNTEFKRIISLSDEGVFLDAVTTDNGFDIENDIIITGDDNETGGNYVDNDNQNNEFIVKGDDDVNGLTPNDESIVEKDDDLQLIKNINEITPNNEFIVSGNDDADPSTTIK
eukprot:242177_1